MANSDNEKRFLEGVINYVDPIGFLGGKERIRIPIKYSNHSSLEVLNWHIIEYTGLKAESESISLFDKRLKNFLLSYLIWLFVELHNFPFFLINPIFIQYP